MHVRCIIPLFYSLSRMNILIVLIFKMSVYLVHPKFKFSPFLISVLTPRSNVRSYATELEPADYPFLTGRALSSNDMRYGGMQSKLNLKFHGFERYQPRVYIRLPTTSRDMPNLVYTQMGEDKVVGCVCEKDSRHVNYWIIKNDGKPRVCECGHWYEGIR